MASRAERSRRKRAKTISLSRKPPEERAAQERAPGGSGEPKYARRKTGLDWLKDKKKISIRQFRAGEKYGDLYRFASMESAAALRSCIAALDGVGGGSGLPPDLLESEGLWIQSRIDIGQARSALSNHSGMVACCDLICGRGLTPREISTVQREAEDIENGLRIALDLLAEHFQIKARS